MAKTLGFGLIGLGEIAYTSTGKLFQEAKHAHMVMGVDPVDHAVKSYEETFGIPCTTDLDAVLQNPVDHFYQKEPLKTIGRQQFKCAQVVGIGHFAAFAKWCTDP